MNQYALATLFDVKEHLKIAHTGAANITNDPFLEGLIGVCSEAAELYLNRQVRARSYTEYHVGDGKTYLWVNHPPINSITSIFVDENRAWTTGEITSTYYTFDEPYKSQGRIQALDGYGFPASNVTNVRVIYNGGFDAFIVTAGGNDYIDWYDQDGGTEISTDLTAATYTGATLAAHIATVMTTDADGDTITAAYNAVTGKFSITSDRADHTFFQLAWNSGTNAAKTAGSLLGFDTSADDTGAATYTGDYATLGIPYPLQAGTWMWVHRLYEESKKGDGRMGISAKNVAVPGGGTTFALLAGMPDAVKAMFAPYRIPKV